MVKVTGNLKILLFIAGIILSAIVGTAATIAKIDFDQQGGAYRFPEKMLLFNVQQKPGNTYEPKILSADIKRLYQMGYFSDIVSETKTLPEDKVEVTIRLQLKPTVKSVIFEGNQKFTEKDLTKEVNISQAMPLNDNQLLESANRLRSFYRGKGYNDATVTPLLKKAGDHQINVVFKIKEHLRLKVNDVVFDGATVYSQWTLRHAIANRYSYLNWILDFGLLHRDELEQDKARLRELYWNLGYLDFKVKKINIQPDASDPEFVNLTFTIFEGEPYRVGKINISGNNIFSESELISLVHVDQGEIFDYKKIRASEKDISDMYESLGYADIACRVIRMPDYKNRTVALNFTIDEGKKYTVKDVVITGNRITKDKVIRRELIIQPGDPLDKNRIEASKNRLMGMGYFHKVEAVTVSSDQLDNKNVAFEVEEKNPFSFKIGGGFSDVNSLVGMAQISNNNFDLFDPQNYFSGGGQRIRLQGIVGLERNSFNIDFTEPWLFDMPLRLDVSGYLNLAQYEYWDETRAGFKTSLSKKIIDDFTSTTLGYKFERVVLNNIDRDRSAEMRALHARDWVSQFTLMLNRDTRDSLMEPTSGYQVNLLSAVSPKIIGSSNNFYRLEAKGNYHYSFLDKAIQCHLGAKIGTVSDFDRNNAVPAYERYFLGGGDTVRGFSYRDIAPTDSDDKPVGGQSMMLGRIEVSHPIWNFIRGAVFVDAGAVGRHSYNYAFSQMNIGAGYGLRIKVPYLNAPVKLDLAYPIVSNQEGLSRKFRFHFNMGFTW